ncbi:YggS family pyridoxal phosphate-dependent enzyme [Alginatibacterium sediminis]|uniref:Pyridoxal phosphate homeostasis protein n=1 Tax=Alginatibacterium sediminis TaxID=2164068 RepID=A0A420E864_9ALTE|nr:YggS family pyridoxal phosphate-dependent enzyme [Alginatibacterium sediminis]RKF15666.1 YggS family pyridoxal phosphate-dependent enzyme [Alginatibacterium sediminis]
MSSITKQIQFVKSQIADYCQQYHREPHAVQLLAVSKTKPLSDIAEAYACGQRHFAENYVQEAVEKIQQAQLSDWQNEPIQWFFIGPLQSNKTRLVAQHFDWVQSIERLKIAQRLSDQRPEEMPALQICLQINISQEANKSGTDFEHVFELAQEVSKLPRIQLRGLMAIAQKFDDPQLLDESFSRLQQCFDQLSQLYPNIDTLSLGMSGDMGAAIAHGSTMVRIGSAIFGARN